MQVPGSDLGILQGHYSANYACLISPFLSSSLHYFIIFFPSLPFICSLPLSFSSLHFFLSFLTNLLPSAFFPFFWNWQGRRGWKGLNDTFYIPPLRWWQSCDKRPPKPGLFFNTLHALSLVYVKSRRATLSPWYEWNCCYSLCTALKLLHLKKLVAFHTLLYLKHRKCLTMMVIKRTYRSDRKQVLLINVCPKVYVWMINIMSFSKLVALNFNC